MDYALSLGITQVHDMGSWTDLETYRRNHSKENLKIRIKIYPWYTNWKNIIKYVQDYGPGDDWLRWNGIKGMMDGSLGSRTAWMHKPYLHGHNHNDKEELPTLGVITIKDTTDFKYLLRQTDNAGIQHAVHAIGDRANDWIINQFKDIANEHGSRDRRSRIEHSQHLSENAIREFASQNIIPSMQPYLNPATGIFAAVTRKTRDGKNEDGWFPNEKISVEDALRCYTINNAYAAFWEKTTGSITVGKNADFIVHSMNYFDIDPEMILESKILRTVVGGKDYLF